MIRIEGIYDEIPSQLRNPKRHFKLSAVEDGARFSEFRDPLFWLADAMIVNNRENRMEIDFLISKKTITNRHNISPIEEKSSKNYTLSSLRKVIAKYGAQLHIPYVIHAGDLKKEEGITFLPLYMTSFI